MARGSVGLPCLPTPKTRAPDGSEWVPRVKHDGYRLIVRRDGNRVRLYTTRRYNWSHRFPRVVDAAMRLKVRSAIIDGEAVVCGADGRSDFDKLRSQAPTIRSCSMPSTCWNWTATTGGRVPPAGTQGEARRFSM
jgi:bifunctional non-homologous end joining protein LigD